MFGKKLMMDIVDRSSETQADRRGFLRGAGVAGLGVLGATAGGAALAAPAFANGDSSDSGDAISDGAILNFALNLEYLEAQFYTIAVYGGGLPGSILSGTGKQGGVTGGHAVPFKDKKIKAYATEIAGDERLHVEFLRGALGGAAVSQPAINFTDAFTAAATAAGLIKAGQSFDPFSSDQAFLLGAYLFEDVGVSAYKGGAPLISNKTYLEAAAGILAIEAYHAGLIRTKLYEMGAGAATDAISAARNALDMNNIDAGVLGTNGKVNITLADGMTAIAPSRTSPQVHNIVYLNPAKGVTSGGFFPNGTNNPDPRLTTT